MLRSTAFEGRRDMRGRLAFRVAEAIFYFSTRGAMEKRVGQRLSSRPSEVRLARNCRGMR